MGAKKRAAETGWNETEAREVLASWSKSGQTGAAYARAALSAPRSIKTDPRRGHFGSAERVLRRGVGHRSRQEPAHLRTCAVVDESAKRALDFDLAVRELERCKRSLLEREASLERSYASPTWGGGWQASRTISGIP